MLCWASLEGAVLAGETDWGIGYILAHDTNVTHVPSSPIAEWTKTIIGGFGYTEHSSNLNARVRAQVERREYTKGTYPNDTARFLDGAAVWTISPQFFTWNIEDVSQVARVNIAAADTPSNRAQVNSLGTGPDFSFLLSAADTAAIGARYGRYTISSGETNNIRYAAYARWLHRVSDQTTLSLNEEETHVDFDKAPPIAPYDTFFRQDQFVRFNYDRRPSLDRITIDAGTTRIVTTPRDKLQGWLARVTGVLPLTTDTALHALFLDEYSDSGLDLLRGGTSAALLSTAGPPEVSLPAPLPVVVTQSLYYGKRSDIAYVKFGEQIGYTLRGYTRNVDYQVVNLSDYHEQGVRFDWTWLYSPGTQFLAYTDYVRRTFAGLDQQDTERNSSVGVIYRSHPRLSFTFQGTRMERSSTAPLQSFVDWRVTLLLGYSTGPLYAVQSRR
jgi:hypothetical protein